MDKRIWAIYIGHLIISMNEIDWMTNIIQSKILGKTISKTFLKKPLSERLESIVKELSGKGFAHDRLKQLLQEALDLCEIRNLVAHGAFALDAREPLKPGEETKFILHSLTRDEPASQSEVEQATKECAKLSDDVSECIAIILMNEARLGNG